VSQIKRAQRLLERGAELRAIRSALSGAGRGSGQVVVIQGSAGIGKSALLRLAVERGRRDGMEVLTATGQDLERNYSFGLVRDLFGPGVLGRYGDRPTFTGSAALAAPIFSSPGAGSVADQLSLLHGLYWLTLGLAERRPLLLVVDDAHWADESSLRFLGYLAPRLADAPICLMVGLRPIEESGIDGGPETKLLGSLLALPTALHLEPQPLSEKAVAEMVAGFGLADPHQWLQRSSWQATRGNPFLLTELLRTGDPELIRSAGSRHWDGTGVPGSIERGIMARLRGATPESRRLAEAVAVLGDDADLARAAELAGLAQETAVEEARRLVELALFDPQARLAFIHPIARSVIYHHIPLAARARAHARAVRLLKGAGAAPETIAPHLLLVDPSGDAEAVAMLRRAAATALGRGDPRTAIRLLQRAVDEPPAPTQQVTVLVELGRAQAAITPDDAVTTYRRALESSNNRRERAAIRLDTGHALINAARWPDAADAFKRGLDEIDDPADPLSALLEAGFVSAAWVSMTKRDEIESRLTRILAAPRLEPAQRELAAWMAFRTSADVSGPASDALRLVGRALEGMSIEQLIESGQIVEVAAGVLVSTDELEREMQLLTDALAAARRSGSLAKLGVYSYCRAWPLYFSGRLADSAADAEEALRAAELGWETFLPAACAVLSWAMLERGDPAAAERAIQVDAERWANRLDYQLLVPIAEGRIHLERGRLPEALDAFRRARDGGIATGVQTPVPPDWRSWAAVTLARQGRRDEAIAVAEEGLAIAERWGADWPIGVALRALGLAQGGESGLETLARAVVVLESGPAQLELARAIVSHGGALRRHGRPSEARDQLARGMDLAHRLGAHRLQQMAHADLLAAGARPRRYRVSGFESLTPSELRVARLATEGHTNREIAQLLFVTPKAVEYHLANAYRKLQIGSRRELATALPIDEPAAARA
jgi:DNA-binding CsgD family transcriptional regulator